MTSFIDDFLLGTCVYWPPGSEASGQGRDFDDYGQPIYGDPEELNCRWDDVNVEFVNPKGTIMTSRAIVMVESDVAVDGVLFNGTLAQATDLNRPKNNENAWEIKRFDKNPLVDYEDYLRRAYL